MRKAALAQRDKWKKLSTSHLCSLKKMNKEQLPLDFEAGSIETLLNIVGINEGITIIPELVIPTLPEERARKIRRFQAPAPVREISLLTYRHFVKEKIMGVIHQHILQAVSPYIDNSETQKIIINI